MYVWMFMLNVKCVCMCIDRHTAYSIASHIQSPFTVTSKTRVESGGMVPFIPFFPYAALDGIVNLLLPPTLIPATPMSHP